MSGIEIRRVESAVHDTVNNQYVPRVEARYELGAEIEGAWVSFASVTEGTVAGAKARADAEANQAAPSPAPPTEPGPPQTMADLTPTPAPQAEAARSDEGASSPSTETQSV